MASCGGYSFERTLLETIELMEFKNAEYTDLELAALVGETLRNMTNRQEEEIARLKCLVDERKKDLQKEKELCSSFTSLEMTYDQPMNKLDEEMAFLRSQNEKCAEMIRKYHTLLECSADDKKSLSRILQDLKRTKNNMIPSELSSDHCILCVCAGNKDNLYSQQHEQISSQLTEKTTQQVRLQNEVDIAVADRKIIQKEIDILSHQVENLSRIVTEVEKAHKKKTTCGCDSGDDEQGCQVGDNNLLWEEKKLKPEHRKSRKTLCSKINESNQEAQEQRSKTPGRFVNVVQSLML